MKEIETCQVFFVVCSRYYGRDPTGRLRYEREIARQKQIPLVAVVIDDVERPKDMFDSKLVAFSKDPDQSSSDILISTVQRIMESSTSWSPVLQRCKLCTTKKWTLLQRAVNQNLVTLDPYEWYIRFEGQSAPKFTFNLVLISGSGFYYHNVIHTVTKCKFPKIYALSSCISMPITANQ